jgi:hypothetical protein
MASIQYNYPDKYIKQEKLEHWLYHLFRSKGFVAKFEVSRLHSFSWLGLRGAWVCGGIDTANTFLEAPSPQLLHYGSAETYNRKCTIYGSRGLRRNPFHLIFLPPERQGFDRSDRLQ